MKHDGGCLDLLNFHACSPLVMYFSFGDALAVAVIIFFHQLTVWFSLHSQYQNTGEISHDFFQILIYSILSQK